jgi:predicted Fe-Mo cluster-binding NifX family protein
MAERVLIPVYLGRISPLLDVAGKFILAKLQDGRVTAREELEAVSPDQRGHLDLVRSTGATTLICSAVSRREAEVLSSRGVELIPHIIGDAVEVIEAYARNDLVGERFIMPGCRWKGRYRGKRCPGYREIPVSTGKEVDYMKCAVTARGKTMDATMDDRFGRAEGFIIVDTETGENSYLENTQALDSPQGAGIQAAKTIIDSGAGVCISGHVGPKAYATLSAAGIEIYQAPPGNTVARVIDSYRSGDLTRLDGADVDGHW